MKIESLLAVLFVGLSTSPLAGQDTDSLAQACDRGDMLSCDHLGLRYQAGMAVNRDLAGAGNLFQQACDGGMSRLRAGSSVESSREAENLGFRAWKSPS